MLIANEMLPGFSEVVAAVGTERFSSCLQRYLHTVCGAEHFAIFELKKDAIDLAAVDPSVHARRQVKLYMTRQPWKSDPMIVRINSCAAERQAILLRADMTDILAGQLDGVYPLVGERVLIGAVRRGRQYALSILRLREVGSMTAEQAGHLAMFAEILISTAAAHATGIRRSSTSRALACLEDIQACVAKCLALPSREVQVTSRLLYGMSIAGIAADLQIGEESVKTYRKRAHQHLGIGSPRELMMWYLREWQDHC